MSSNYDEGQILTNYHVIEGGEGSITVTVDGTRIYNGVVVGYDAFKDVALLSICCSLWFTIAELSDDGLAPVGTEVMALGYPLGTDELTLTRGIVSANLYYDGDWIQTDAAINPGNSGGPLISYDTGRVIGINTSKFIDESVEGIGYAISATTIAAILSDLELGTRTERPLVPTPTPIPRYQALHGIGVAWPPPAETVTLPSGLYRIVMRNTYGIVISNCGDSECTFFPPQANFEVYANPPHGYGIFNVWVDAAVGARWTVEFIPI